MFAIIARPAYDFHVNAYEANQHAKLVAWRLSRDAETIKRERRSGSRAYRG